MKFTTGVAATVAALALSASAAFAQTTTLRIQTHFPAENASGKFAQSFVDDVHAMSNGDIKIEMFFGASVVASAETWDAAVTGILDCDMTGASYQSGKNPAFQFANDLSGAYLNPYQMYGWMLHGGGAEKLNELYNPYNMEFVGWWIPGAESLNSTKPIGGVADLKDWKFRSPPGIISMIFSNLGASPIVMDFNDVFTALETGIIDGADYANITSNDSIDLYSLAPHTNYPGFHSMPADHLACRKDVWDGMPDHHKAIIKAGMNSMALRLTTFNEVTNNKTAARLAEEGVNIYQWSAEDMLAYSDAVKAAWTEYATTPEAKDMLGAHVEFLQSIGAMK